MAVIKVEKFSAIILSVSLPLCLFLLGLLQCICWSLRLCWLHSFSFCSSDLIISIVLTSSLLIFLPAQIYFWVPWVNSSFQLLYCSDPEFLFGSFLYLIDISILFKYYFLTLSMSFFSFLNVFKTVVLKVFFSTCALPEIVFVN